MNWSMPACTCLVPVIAVILTACSAQPEPPTDITWHLHTVQPAPRDHLTLELTGSLVGGDWQTVDTPVAWVPLEWVVAEGSAVAAGDPLLRYEEATLRQWIGRDVVALAETRAQAAHDRLAAERDLAEARNQRQRLEADLRVQDAIIEASLAKDREAIAIARLRLDGIERQLAAAERERERLQPLVAGGYASRRRLSDLHDEISRLQAEHEPARIELDILERTTNSVTRARAQLQRAKLALRLDEEDSALTRRREHLAEKLAESDRLAGLASARQVQSYQMKVEMLDSSELAADASGIVEYATDELRSGAKLGSAALFVLDESGIQARFLVPETHRDALGRGTGTRAQITADALPGLEWQGAVTSVSALNEPLPTGIGRGFPVTVAIEADSLGDLAFGMSVTCRLEIPLADRRALLPIWTLDDLREPRVIMADGTSRKISGRVVGNRFVVEDGLAAGEAIRLPATPPDRSTARIAAAIELVDYVAVGPSHHRLELVSMIPDGSQVAVGDEVASFLTASNDGDLDATSKIAHQSAEAAIDLERARREVAIQIADKRIAWQEARLDVQRAELDLAVDRYGSLDRIIANAQAALTRSQIALTRAEREVAALDDPTATRSLSDRERRQRTLRHRITELDHTKARLGLVADRRTRDLLKIWNLEEGLADARDRAALARQAYALEQERGAQRLSEAQSLYRDRLERIDDERELLADLHLTAPASGRIYLTTDRWGRRVEIGDRLPRGEFMRIETGPERRLVFEVPVRFYDRLRDRRELTVVVPSLGDQRLRGRVVAIGHAFREAGDATEQLQIPGHIGSPDRIFECTVRLDLEPDLAADLPPGVTAYLDLPRDDPQPGAGS